MAPQMRRRTGSEPGWPGSRATPVLKTGRGTSRLNASTAHLSLDGVTIRLTQYAHGGGCACKIPPGELEGIVAGLVGTSSPDVLVGLDDGDDAAVVRLPGGAAGAADPG